jgi:hypothetical protein
MRGNQSSIGKPPSPFTRSLPGASGPLYFVYTSTRERGLIMPSELRNNLIRLAYMREDIRPFVLPMLDGEMSRMAREFPSPEALNKYLKNHPNAQKNKHTVAKPSGEEKPKEEKQPSKEKPSEKEKPQSKKKNKDKGKGQMRRVLGPNPFTPPTPPKSKPKVQEAKKALEKSPKHVLSEAVVAVVSPDLARQLREAPDDVQQFIYDNDHRTKILKETAGALNSGGKKIRDAVRSTVGEVLSTVKKAGPGISKMFSGKELDKDETAAVNKVVSHVSGLVSAALASSKPMKAVQTELGASFLGSIANKIEQTTRGEMKTLFESGGLAARLSKTLFGLSSSGKKKASEESDQVEAFAVLIAEIMQKALEDGLSNEDMLDALGDVE